MGKTRRNYELELPFALEFDIRCQTARKSFEWQTHPVTINRDWSVTTPHDLEAERVAVAFGGWLSCLELDKAVAAAKHGTLLAMRRKRYPLWREDMGRWRFKQPATPNAGFSCAPLAVAHMRSPRYLAEMFDAPEWLIRAVSAELARVYGGHFVPPAEEDDSVRENLWHYGLHPDTVTRLVDSTGAGTRHLPLEFWLGAAYSGVSRRWLREVLSKATNDTDAVTLAWAGAASDVLQSWLDIGFLPNARQFTVMASLGKGHSFAYHPPVPAPTPADLDKLASLLANDVFTRADLAILLTIVRKPRNVVRRLRRPNNQLQHHLTQVHEARQ